MRIRLFAMALCALMMIALPLGALSEAIPDMSAPDEPVRLRSARIRAVGDLMVHEKQLKYARQADGSYDFHPQYALVADALGNADYTIANLETTIGKAGKKPYSGFPMFNSPEALLDTVRDSGVDFLTIANNHMLDRYLDGLYRTIDNVEACGFDYGGGNRSPEECDRPVIVDVNDIKIGFLCYTQMTNGVERFCGKDAKAFAVNYLKADRIEDDVRRIREAGAEVVIAIPHWGQEYHRKPEANTVKLARKMIAAGVDVILGSHPHMVQPVEYVTVELEDGTTRTGLVAYSMGNFISNMSRRYTDSGIIVEFTLLEKQDGGFEAVDVGVVPIYNWHSGSLIQAVPSLKYYDDPPEGMGSPRANRMRASCREIRELMGEDIALLAE